MAVKKRPAAKKTVARKPARKAVKKAARKAARKPAPRKAARKRAGAMSKRFEKFVDAPAAKAPARKAAKPAAKPSKKKYVLKTKATSQNVGQFLAGITDAAKRADAEEIARMLGEITGVEARMWGPSIVGFGQYHYKYESGHEGDMCIAGFSPRKDALTMYVVPGFERYGELMARLGKYRTGKGCLYVKRLDDVDRSVLRELLERSVAMISPHRTA
jgi:hypothetical protein